MNINNYIETLYRDLKSDGLNVEFIDFYSGIDNQKLRESLSTLHYELVRLFKLMNSRLPTGNNEAHFWADSSRQLINVIEQIIRLQSTLKYTAFSFEIDEYYLEIIKKCRIFLSSSGGSAIPANMEKIELYYAEPIFKINNTIAIENSFEKRTFELKRIGEGSYAYVYKYTDDFYNKEFVIKRAKKDLTPKELERFRREFDVMKELSSPYIVEVFKYDDSKSEYLMEYMDSALSEYIKKSNSVLSKEQRKGIVYQILRAFEYIHNKGKLHRDISPNNILIKIYEDVNVIKVSDFGLVKIPDSDLTSLRTELKGYFNDPALLTEGFSNYNILHETYALTRLVYFVMTGRTNMDRISDKMLSDFVLKGVNPDKEKRFKNVSEMATEFKKI